MVLRKSRTHPMLANVPNPAPDFCMELLKEQEFEANFPTLFQ